MRPTSIEGTTVTPKISAGTNRVMNRNALERTRSRYSRRAMSSILRMVLPHGFNEDFFERGLHQFKLADPRTGGNLVQELLGIGAGSQPDFNVVAVVVVRSHQPGLPQEVAVTLVFDLYIVLAVLRLDLLEVALQHRFSAIDEADGVAQLLHLVHAVG